MKGLWIIGLAAIIAGASGGVVRADGILSQGPVVAGDGLPDGIGATLARLFLKVALPGRGAGQEKRLELVFTSSLVEVEPIACTAASPEPCKVPGRGEAGVAGFPTRLHETVLAVKLAAARYLESPGAVQGDSLEVALEGSLYVSLNDVPGDPVSFRLFPGEAQNLFTWATQGIGGPGGRVYENFTGSGLLLGDEDPEFFPGWLRGSVLENSGNSVLVGFDAAEFPESTSEGGDGKRVQPDVGAAADAGLPQGTFGILEVNYGGIPSASRVLPGAASNDVEIRMTAVERRASFLRGDCDGDGSVVGSVSDAIVLLLYNFSGGREPPCLAACDADGDGEALGRVSDALYLLRYLFLGGPPPPEPYPECGLLEAGSELGCANPPPSCGD